MYREEAKYQIPRGIYEDFICLDFRVNKQNPEIVYWNYELALENPIEGITLLYSSMDELIIELKKG